MASQTIKGLTVQISGDTTKLGNAVKDAENKSKSLGRELSEVNKLLKQPDANAVELLAQKQQILTERVSATKEKLDTLKAAQESVQAQFDKGEITAEQYRAFQREIQYTANEMQGYEKAIQQTTKQLAEAKVKTGEEANSLEMLRSKISMQEQELAGLREQYKNAVIAEGENSDKAKELKAQYDALNGKLAESKQKMTEAEKAASALGQSEQTALSPLDALKKTISEQEKELSGLSDQYKSAVLAEGENSDKAKELKAQYEALNGKLSENRQKMSETEKAASSLGQTEQAALSPLDALKKSVADQEKELTRLNTEYQNAVIQYGKNSAQAKALTAQIKTLSTEHQNQKAKLQDAEKAAKDITATEKTLTERYKEQKSELDTLKERYTNAVLQHGRFSSEARTLAKQISSLSEELGKKEKKMQSAEKSAGKFDRTLSDTSQNAGKAAKNVRSLGDSAKDAENGFSTAAVAVGTFMGNLALNVLNDAAGLMKQIASGALETGSSFEAAMSQVAATQGFSISDIQNNTKGAAYTMDLLTEKAREMGAATSFSASQAADGLNVLLMSGYDAEQSIQMVENVLHEAEAGGISIAESAQYIAGSMKGFKKQSEEFADSAEASAYYADLMAKGATLAATNVPQLGQSLSGVAATANTYSQNADSVTISLLRLAEQGEVGAGAATALSAAMKNLYSPTDTAKNALNKLGVSAYDAEGNARDFNVVVGELDKALSELTGEERASLEDAIFGIQGQAAFDKMVVTSGEKLQSFYDGIAEANGSAALQSETMLDNLRGDITKLQSAYSDLEITIYNGANEPIRHVVQTITDDMLPAINHLVSGVEDADKEVGAAVGRLVSTILTEVKEMLPGVVNVANSIILTLTENLPQIAGGIGDMVMILLDGLTDILPSMIPALAKSIRQIISMVFRNIGSLAGTAGNLVQMIAESLLNELPKIGSMLVGAVGTLTSDWIPALTAKIPELLNTILSLVMQNLPALLASLRTALQSLLSGLIPLVSELIPSLLETIVQFLNDGIPMLLNAAVELFSVILQALPDLITALAEALPDIITTIIDVLLTNIPVVLDTATTLLIAIVDALPEFLEALTAALPEIIISLIDFFTADENLAKILDSAFTLLSAMIDCVPDVISQLVLAAADIVMAILTAIGEKLPDMAQSGAELFESLIEKGAEIIQKIVMFVPELITSIIGAISEHFQDLQDAGMNMFNQIGQGIKNMISGAYEWGADLIDNFVSGVFGGENEITKAAENIGERIWEFLHFSEPEKGKLSDFSTYAPDMMKTFADGISGNASLIINELAGLSDDMAEKSSEAGKNFLDNMMPFLKQTPEQTKIHLKNTLKCVIDWGRELKEKAGSAAADMVSAIESTVRSLPDKMADVGRNLVAGIWNGMRERADWLLSNVSGFCENIISNILDVFQIRSPAKRTVYVGEMLDAGVAVGVQQNEDEPINAMRQMAANLMDETAVIPERLSARPKNDFSALNQFPAADAGLSEKLDRILQAIEAGQVLMLDGNKLVGGTANQMNTALGQIRAISTRR